MRRLRSRWDSQHGVAMVTVLLIGSALTVVTTAAAFVTIGEFRSGSDDRKALAALSYAEAGIDRMVNHLRTGLVTFNDMNSAGCSDPPLSLPDGNVGVGSYSVSLTVYDPVPSDQTQRFPIPPTGGACANRPESPHPGQDNDDRTFFVITSEGRHPAATRTIRQVIAMEPINLPVGIYANSIDISSAIHEFQTVSMVSETIITNRGTLGFVDNDPYYLISDFFPGVTGRALTDPVPAAAHAAGTIYLKQSRDAEFEDDTKNCAANNEHPGIPDAVASQSLWDSDSSGGSITDGCAGQVGWPSSSFFDQAQLADFATPNLSAQDHQVLKDAAKRYGVYCSFPGFGGTGTTGCVQQGIVKAAAYPAYIEDVAAGTPSFVVYLEFLAGSPDKTENDVREIFEVWGCNDDPDLNRSVVVIIRNGGINWTGAGGQKINGALIMDGNFRATGGFEFNGSLIVKGSLSINSSSQHFSVDDCWVKNFPGPFMRALPTQWSEIDR